MKRKRFSIEQIVAVLKQVELGTEDADRRIELGQSHLATRSCKKVARPALRRDVVDYVVSHYGLTMRRACRLVKQPRSVQYDRSVKDPHPEPRSRMGEIAYTRVRYGYRRVHVLLRRGGRQLGRNQAYRLYCEEQLQLRAKLPKRRKMVVTRVAKIVPVRPNDAWSMDFLAGPATYRLAQTAPRDALHKAKSSVLVT